jgi:hypothetical protein
MGAPWEAAFGCRHSRWQSLLAEKTICRDKNYSAVEDYD